MFEKLSRFTEKFAYHRFASFWLFFYAVMESLIFPIPPDVLLVALTLGRPKRDQGFAFLAAFGSMVGGAIGYMLGRYAFDPIVRPLLEWLCQYNDLLCPTDFVPRLEHLFQAHGLWIVAFSAFSPIIPYRLMILVAGMAKMPLIPFMITSLIVHWIRYAIVCRLVRVYGRKAVRIVRTRLPLAILIISGLALVIYCGMLYF